MLNSDQSRRYAVGLLAIIATILPVAMRFSVWSLATLIAIAGMGIALVHKYRVDPTWFWYAIAILPFAFWTVFLLPFYAFGHFLQD